MYRLKSVVIAVTESPVWPLAGRLLMLLEKMPTQCR
jgi:hypothetical protein